MERITVDKGVRERLGGLNDWLEFVDKTGRSLGQFVPARDIRQPLPDNCPYTPAQLAVIRFQNGGRLPPEIRNELGLE